ncbi:MAG: hypothetical protein V3T23_02595 [Nitrososphaerales archaeon]
MADPKIVILVHGWSVTNTNTYGELAARLKSAAGAQGLPVDIKNIWLSKYVSFADEVSVEDLARGFEAAIHRELGKELKKGRRFACITHSTGGPVIRDWWARFHPENGTKECPMSHLVMLAPANFGSALAQLGKSRVSRLKTWFQGVEPGQGVLNWLELGSPASWDLNHDWIHRDMDPVEGHAPVFPFVLTGQTIDRKLYDNLNPYTGELGSDGVVRVPAANLNATYIRLVQNPHNAANPNELVLDKKRFKTTQRTAFALIRGHAHSGEEKGILRSIKDDGKPHPTVRAIMACLKVQTSAEYVKVHQIFENENQKVRQSELIEKRSGFFTTRYFIHDQRSMVTIRLRDHLGHSVTDFDFLLTGGRNNPDLLPESFFVDRQRNSRDRGTLTYFINHTLMEGSAAIRHKPDNHTVRPALQPMTTLGLRIIPRPGEGFVHYREAVLRASKQHLTNFLNADQTTLVDIVLRRVVGRGVFALKNSNSADPKGEDFRRQKPGSPIL